MDPQSPNDRAFPFWGGLYDALLRLFPRSWRHEFADDSRALFLDLIGEARRERGDLAAAWLAARCCAELVPAAFAVRRELPSPSGGGPMNGLLADAWFAWRGVTRQPRHAAVVVITLAMGIGTVTTTFSLLDAAALRDLPFPDAEHLVEVSTWLPERNMSVNTVDGDALGAWREQTELFDRLEAVSAYSPFTVLGETPMELEGARVTPGALTMLGARPRLGRLLAESDREPGAPPTVLVSESFWRAQLGGRDELADTRLELDGTEHRVVGVVAAGFAFPRASVQVWTPFDPTASGSESRARTYGRLLAGLTVPEANRLAARLAEGLAERNPRPLGWGIRMSGFDQLRTEDSTRTALWIALGAASLMLLVAVLNVVHVVLARIVDREGELAVRSAIGAGRTRILRQVLLEVLLLATGGGLVGLTLSVWLVSFVSSLAPERLVRFDAVVVGVDLRAVGFALGVTILAALLGSVLPAASALRRSAAGALGDGRHGLTRSGSHRRLRFALIVTEATAVMVLLAGAGLLTNTFVRLATIDPGFDAESIVSMSLHLDEERYPTAESREDFLNAVAGRLEALPSVAAATATRSRPPMPGGVGFRRWFETDDGEILEDFLIVPWGEVQPEYFDVAGVRLVSGRTFLGRDDPETSVIISEPFARTLFGARPAVGRRFRTSQEGDWFEVVGVVEPVAAIGLAEADDHQMYRPLVPGPDAAVVVRVSGESDAVVRSLRQIVWDLDPRQPVRHVAAGTERVGEWVREPRFYALLMGTFALLSSLLAMVGIFGVVGHAVSSRTREIGVRTALGATGRSILMLAMRGGLAPALIGLALGLVIVAQIGGVIDAHLYEIQPTDPATLLVAAALLLLAVSLASYLPARRALRVDPVQALRSE